MPDLRYVPEKYHEFMSPGVRKLYVEIPANNQLKERVASLEARVKSLHKDNARLMDVCEANMAASTKHAENERDARQEAYKLTKEMATLRLKYDALKRRQQYVTLAISIRTLISFSSLAEKLLNGWTRTCPVTYPHSRVQLAHALSAWAKVPQQPKQSL